MSSAILEYVQNIVEDGFKVELFVQVGLVGRLFGLVFPVRNQESAQNYKGLGSHLPPGVMRQSLKFVQFIRKHLLVEDNQFAYYLTPISSGMRRRTY